jgi:hypothetical protein
MAFRFFLCFFLFRLFKVSKKRSLFFVSKKTFLGLFVCIFLRFLCAERERSSLREAKQSESKKKKEESFFLWFCDCLSFFKQKKSEQKGKTKLFENSQNSEKLQIQQIPNTKKILNFSSQIECSQIEEEFRIFL